MPWAYVPIKFKFLVQKYHKNRSKLHQKVFWWVTSSAASVEYPFGTEIQHTIPRKCNKNLFWSNFGKIEFSECNLKLLHWPWRLSHPARGSMATFSWVWKPLWATVLRVHPKNLAKSIFPWILGRKFSLKTLISSLTIHVLILDAIRLICDGGVYVAVHEFARVLISSAIQTL